MGDIRFTIPEEIEQVREKLEVAGYPTYLVGGCVRDMLMGIPPKDYDMTTAATPEEMKRVFQGIPCKTVGSAFGTVGVFTEKGTVEITTFRKDGRYINHRKPETVEFSDNVRDDLSRRDFTVNALAYRKESGLLDLFGGLKDLKEKRLCAVGDPMIRFEEDALRILRGIRFASQLNFQPTEDVLRAMEEKRKGLRSVSPERIAAETDRLLLTEKPSIGIYIMAETGVLEEVFPELVPTVGYDQMTPYHDKTLFDHILCVTDYVPPKLSLRYAALFHDIAKPGTLSVDEKGKGHFYGHDVLGSEAAVKILKRYKASNRKTKETALLIREHMKAHPEMTDKALRRQIRKVGKDLIFDLYDLMIADRACTTEGRDLEFLIRRKERIRELIEEEGVIETRSLAVDGNDVLAAGLKPGPGVGEILDELLEDVTSHPEHNDRDYLLDKIERLIEKEKDSPARDEN